MKVLVIGGAGYIGSHVVRALLDEGHQVTVFDNLSSGLRVNLFPEAEFIHGDIMMSHELISAMRRGFDSLVHLAAFKAAGESMMKPEKYSLNNISGTINILNAACATGVRSIVFSSSAAVYGEPTYLPIDEKHPTDPSNFYGFTKREIEKFLDWYDRLKGLKYASLRYFNAAGYDTEGRIGGLERNPANLLPVIMEVAAGTRDKLMIFGDDYETDDGTGVRDYVHVSDLATAHVLALDKVSKTDTSLTVNLGSDSGLSVRQILDAAREITGATIPAEIGPRRPGDPAKLVASSDYARDYLQWSPGYSDLRSLVSSTWNAYRENHG